MLRTLMTGAAAIVAMVPAQAYAQTASELTMFNRGQFKGTRVVVAAPRQGIEPPMTVRSVLVPPGTQWELCSGSTYSGCRQFSESQPSMVMTVRSVRPVAPVLTSTATAVSSRIVTPLSLRGLASEYFVAPEIDGNRVEVQSGTAEAMSERSREFCRSRGWRSSAYQRLQTVGQTSYLVDVLCVDTGG